MSKKFNYKTLEELEADIKGLGLNLNSSANIDALAKPIHLKKHRIPNCVVAHPMEGGDANNFGSPTDQTFRKYERMAKGGYGLIWVEAVSVCDEGRSNPGQLWITDKSLPEFKELVRRTLKAAEEFHPKGERPLLILQLQHSGRYSKPRGEHAPIIASHIPELDKRFPIDETYPLVTDEYLSSLVDQFVKAAVLAREAGFDGVDIKACHGYLLHELLSCYDREGEYGGSFENRTKLMLRIVDEIKAAAPELVLASRINIFDAMPIGRGFGMATPGSDVIDMSEPVRLTKELVARGVELVSITMGNPYYITNTKRSYDLDTYMPNNGPLDGTCRLIKGAADLQVAVPEAKVVGVGYSWFRGFSPYVAAAVLEQGKAAMIGYGRQILSYPNLYKDVIREGKFDLSKACVACSKCSQLKRDVGAGGCVVRSTEGFLQIKCNSLNI